MTSQEAFTAIAFLASPYSSSKNGEHMQKSKRILDHTDLKPMCKRKIKEVQVLEIGVQSNLKRRKLTKSLQSIHHGVTWDDEKQKWWACRRIDGILRSGGYFVKEDDAAQRSDQLVVAHKANPKIHPLNFPRLSFVKNEDEKIKFRTQRRKLVSEAGRKSKRGIRQSQYLGVYWNRFTGKWVAKRNLNRQPRNAGSFVDEIEAAKASDDLVRKYGCHEPLNFPYESELVETKPIRRKRKRLRNVCPISSVTPDRNFITDRIVDHRNSSMGLEFRVIWQNSKVENWVLDLDLPDTAIKRAYILQHCSHIRKLKLPCAKCKDEYDSREMILLHKKRFCATCYQVSRAAEIPKRIAPSECKSEAPRFKIGEQVYVKNWIAIKSTLDIDEDDSRGLILDVSQKKNTWVYCIGFPGGEKLRVYEEKLSAIKSEDVLKMLESNLDKAKLKTEEEKSKLKESEKQMLNLDKEITSLENALISIQSRMQNLEAKRQHLGVTKTQREAKRKLYQQRCVEHQRTIQKHMSHITSIERQLLYHSSDLKREFPSS